MTGRRGVAHATLCRLNWDATRLPSSALNLTLTGCIRLRAAYLYPDLPRPLAARKRCNAAIVIPLRFDPAASRHPPIDACGRARN
jgi:hypothetical protein